MAIEHVVGVLAGPLGHDTYLAVLDRFHRLYTDAALRTSLAEEEGR